MSKRSEPIGTNYDNLSLRDLVEARDLYHVHLMNRPNVVATALGRYRIRIADSWPNKEGTGRRHLTGERTLENSQVRPYSWPAVLVFVEQWLQPSEFSGRGYSPDDMVPKTLYMPDGRKIPVCVIKAPRQIESPNQSPDVLFPINNLGGGFPVVAKLQERQHVATIGCLVTDGHKIYALTNRHVAGDAGEILYSKLSGKLERIGSSSARQLTRKRFAEVYPGWPDSNVYVNLDIGLIEIDDLNFWTAQVREIGTLGPMVDVSSANFSLSLLDQYVAGFGCAGRFMEGQIDAFFYRYKSQGGLDYMSDFLIGPRTPRPGVTTAKTVPLRTQPGDSGTLWTIEAGEGAAKTYSPLAVQWGTHLLRRGAANEAQPFVLATCLSTVCSLLNVDVVRDWNLDQPDTWGAIGHFSIGTSVVKSLTNSDLKKLMGKNSDLISPDAGTISGNEFKGMGDDAFVPLADVPDMFWKPRIAHQGFSRPFEGPNHFADMDQPRPSDGKDLLALCKKPAFIQPDKWNEFYGQVTDLLTGDPISAKHRGLLPFRVWQIYNDMVTFAGMGKKGTAKFVCAAGVLTHYIGDACQPLHISYLHDGDPEDPQTRTVHHQDGTTETVIEPLGKGVHAAYEDMMISLHRDQILEKLAQSPKVKQADLIHSGSEAAQATIAMMRSTFKRLPPSDIVAEFVQFDGGGKARAEHLWQQFGKKTITNMQDGVHLLAVLWQSAWVQGGGTAAMAAQAAISEEKAMEICADRDYLPSMTIDKIGSILN